MKNSINTHLDAFVHDNAEAIKESGKTAAEYILDDTEAEDQGWLWFLSEEEIEEFENDKEKRAEHIQTIKDYVNENYSYKVECE